MYSWLPPIGAESNIAHAAVSTGGNDEGASWNHHQKRAARLCAEHQPQRHGEATRFGIIRRLWASALAAAGPSDTAAVRWWFQDAPERRSTAPLTLTRFRTADTVRIPWE